MVTHEEVMNWLESDRSNVKRFLKAIDKIVKGQVVLVEGVDDCLVTGFMARKRNCRVRR